MLGVVGNKLKLRGSEGEVFISRARMAGRGAGIALAFFVSGARMAGQGAGIALAFFVSVARMAGQGAGIALAFFVSRGSTREARKKILVAKVCGVGCQAINRRDARIGGT